MQLIVLISLVCLLAIEHNLVRACLLEIDEVDEHNTRRKIYENNIVNITGRVRFCPPSIIVRNISILNPMLKRVSILNVSYQLEANNISITILAKLIGFAPITVQIYFDDQNEFRRTARSSATNVTIDHKRCAIASPDRMTILQNCPMLKFERGFYVLKHDFCVAVKRRQTIIDALFTGVVTFLVAMGTLCIGCNLLVEQFINSIKRPIPLIIGFLCQVIYVPLLSYALSKLFKLPDSTSLGLLATASTPGGGSSNIYTALLGGDLDLSVTMTFASTVGSFGTFPFWIWLIGKSYVDFKTAKFPWWSMFLSLFALLIPASIGLMLRRYRPVLANRIARFLNPIAIGYLVFILTFGIYINMYIFSIVDFKAIMACCLLPWLGFLGGAIFSIIGVRDKRKIVAICIETGIQNTAVSIFFLRLTFPQPESDIALANPILVLMATPVPFIVLIITKSILKKSTCWQKCLPAKMKAKINAKNIVNGKAEQTLEKSIAKELLEESEEEKQPASQITKTNL